MNHSCSHQNKSHNRFEVTQVSTRVRIVFTPSPHHGAERFNSTFFQVACGEQHNLARVLPSSKNQKPPSSGTGGGSSTDQQAELWVWGGGRLGQVRTRVLVALVRFHRRIESAWRCPVCWLSFSSGALVLEARTLTCMHTQFRYINAVAAAYSCGSMIDRVGLFLVHARQRSRKPLAEHQLCRRKITNHTHCPDVVVKSKPTRPGLPFSRLLCP